MAKLSLFACLVVAIVCVCVHANEATHIVNINFANLLAGFNPESPQGPINVMQSTVDYDVDGVTMQGVWVVPTVAEGEKVPGVLFAHLFAGMQQYEIDYARELVEEKNVAVFLLDVYGKGVRFEPNTQANEAFGTMHALLGDRGLLQRRALAGLDVLLAHPSVDTTKIAAWGFCFGGNIILELARTGTAAVHAYVSYHGVLSKGPNGIDSSEVHGKFLILTGREDPTVPASDVEDFQADFDAKHVDYTVTVFGGAKHAFTWPQTEEFVENNPSFAGVAAYSPLLTARSFQAAHNFMDEVFNSIE